MPDFGGAFKGAKEALARRMAKAKVGEGEAGKPKAEKPEEFTKAVEPTAITGSN